MMAVFRNFAGLPFRNGPEAKRQPIEKVARVTGLEPATSGVTGRAVSQANQRPFRKSHRRNDATPTKATASVFGTVQARATPSHSKE